MPTLNLAFIFKTTLNLVPYIETRRTTFVFFDSLEEGNFEAFNKKQRRSILGLPERSNEGQPLDLQPEPKKATLGPSTRTQEGQSLDFQREAKKVNPWTSREKQRRSTLGLPERSKEGQPLDFHTWRMAVHPPNCPLSLIHLSHVM